MAVRDHIKIIASKTADYAKTFRLEQPLAISFYLGYQKLWGLTGSPKPSTEERAWIYLQGLILCCESSSFGNHETLLNRINELQQQNPKTTLADCVRTPFREITIPFREITSPKDCVAGLVLANCGRVLSASFGHQESLLRIMEYRYKEVSKPTHPSAVPLV